MGRKVHIKVDKFSSRVVLCSQKVHLTGQAVIILKKTAGYTFPRLTSVNTKYKAYARKGYPSLVRFTLS